MPSTDTDCPTEQLLPALRAVDERTISTQGHLVAIAKPKRERTAVRRASIVLGQHWRGARRVDPAEVADGLRMWWLLNGQPLQPESELSPVEWAERPFAHWPPHGSPRACGEGDCRRCELEREHDEATQR
jgi:hypothetical protein